MIKKMCQEIKEGTIRGKCGYKKRGAIYALL